MLLANLNQYLNFLLQSDYVVLTKTPHQSTIMALKLHMPSWPLAIVL